MSLQLKVRAERPADLASIRALNLAAFGQPDEAEIVDGVRGTADWIDGGSLVAETAEGEIVGHLLLSLGRLAPDDGNPAPIWLLGPVAVLPRWQRQGVGRALMHAAIDLATEREQPLICLVGHATYYPRFGFEPARRLGIEPPAGWSDSHWLALRLPAWQPELRGRVAYPPAFGID
jgi:putative acetyltransferase